MAHKLTSITTTDYLDAMPTPGAGFGVLVVSKQSTPTISSAGVNGTPLPELAVSAPSTRRSPSDMFESEMSSV
jgi:hypothetical protein